MIRRSSRLRCYRCHTDRSEITLAHVRDALEYIAEMRILAGEHWDECKFEEKYHTPHRAALIKLLQRKQKCRLMWEMTSAGAGGAILGAPLGNGG